MNLEQDTVRHEHDARLLLHVTSEAKTYLLFEHI